MHVFLVHRLTPSSETDTREILVRGKATLGDLRVKLEEKSDEELNRFLKQAGLLPLPSDRDTKQKRINYLMENLPISTFQSSNRRFERAAFFATSSISVLAIVFWVKAFWLQQAVAEDVKRAEAQEVVIRKFFESLNEGIRGNPSGWEKYWDCMSSNRKDREQKRYDGGLPQKYKSLYPNCTSASVMVIAQNNKGNIYTVVNNVMERLPRSTIVSWFEENSKGGLDIYYSRFSTHDKVVETVLEDLEKHFQLKSSMEKYQHMSRDELRHQIAVWIKGQNLATISGRQFLTKIVDKYGLPWMEDRNPTDDSKKFSAYEVVRVREFLLIEENNQWKVERIQEKAIYSHELLDDAKQ